MPAGLLGMAACGESLPPGAVSKTIGPEGGLISSNDDVLTLVFQPGALRREYDVVVSPSDEPPPIFGLAYRVRPDINLRVGVEVTYRRVLPLDLDNTTIGAIRLDDYTDEMGYWEPLPLLALNADQQSVIAADDELSLYYGLLDGVVVPQPTDPDGGETTAATDGPADDTTGAATTTSASGTSGESTGSSGSTAGTDSSSTGEATTGDTDPGTTGTTGGMPMPQCGDGTPVAGELCLTIGADYAAGLDPVDVEVAAFGAGVGPDVVTLDAGTLELGMLPGNGDGTLGAAVTVAALGGAPTVIAVADFSGAGGPDVAVADTATDTVRLLTGDGVGGLAAPLDTMTGLGLAGIDVANFDGDAAADLTVLNATDLTVQMLLGDATGMLVGPVAAIGVDTNLHVTTGSLNAMFDPFDDILAVGPAGFHGWATDGLGTAFLADNTGVFGMGGDFTALTMGDVDGDGNGDMVALDTTGDTMIVGLGPGGPGAINFLAPIVVGADPSDVVLVDLDGDGDSEALVCSQGSDELMVFEWDAGAYAPAFTFVTGAGPRALAVGDLDGDTVLDVVVANEGSDTVTVVRSDP